MFASLLLLWCVLPVFPFSLIPSNRARQSQCPPLYSTTTEPTEEELLASVSRDTLVDWCRRLQISVQEQEETKDSLLKVLRNHAQEQVRQQQAQRQARKRKIEEGSDDPREKFETVGEEDDDEDDEIAFLIPATSTTMEDRLTEIARLNAKSKSIDEQNPLPVTAPLYPDEPNAQGERVATIYSTKDTNDLTSMHQTPHLNDDMPGVADEVWKQQQQQPKKSTDTEPYTKVIRKILATTGMEAYMDDDDDDNIITVSRSSTPRLDPSHIPTAWLEHLLDARLLDEALREFELQAIGYDGDRADDGGHYRIVSQVRAFWMGYLTTHQRTLARECCTSLLNTLVNEGIVAMDVALGAMVVDESILHYLQDVIREYQQKVEATTEKQQQQQPSSEMEDINADPVNALWNVTLEDGETIHSIDPNDENVREQLMNAATTRDEAPLPQAQSPTQQVLQLLQLLRDRIQTELSTPRDEKGNNLRLLAYVLKLPTLRQQEEWIEEHLGKRREVCMQY